MIRVMPTDGAAAVESAVGVLRLSIKFNADVAKLVNALGLEPSAREGLGVRVSPSAPNSILYFFV